MSVEESYYSQKLKEIQNVFCEGAANLIRAHFNYFIDKYGNWNKYPRKIKKKLKKSPLWNLRYHDKIKEDELKIEMREYDKF